ncbi:hypothetical protein JXI42_14495 [bacterium]|nr:hypothetical protein [bacterium]
MKTNTLKPKYVINGNGEKEEVIIPIKDFNNLVSLVDDALDVRLIEATENEEVIHLDDYIKERGKRKN